MYHTPRGCLYNNMELQLLALDTTPAHYRHVDDRTACAGPDECHRELYVKAGPLARHMDDDTPCTTPKECSHIGRDTYVAGGLSD